MAQKLGKKAKARVKWKVTLSQGKNKKNPSMENWKRNQTRKQKKELNGKSG